MGKGGGLEVGYGGAGEGGRTGRWVWMGEGLRLGVEGLLVEGEGLRLGV
jgi:hypothetical protein